MFSWGLFLSLRKIVIKIGKKKRRKPESSEESDDDPPPQHTLKDDDSVSSSIKYTQTYADIHAQYKPTRNRGSNETGIN